MNWGKANAMPGVYLLDWAIRAISLFNTMILLWLGITVLLNVEHRRWGTWVATGGLLLGAAFFAIHSAIMGRLFERFPSQIAFWWHLIWLPFLFSPYLWYLVLVWYTGVLRARRQRIWLALVSFLGLVALLFTSNLPTYDDLVRHSQGGIFSPGGLPTVLLLYPAYGVLCLALSLAVLYRPGSSERFMGNLARRRARPWLIAASCVLLAVTLCAGGIILALLHILQTSQTAFDTSATRATLMSLDALISALIALAVVLVGQGVVAYEIFTGKVLPRGGLARHWRRILILAGGYSVAVAGCLEMPVDPMYPLVLATVIMTAFYALLGWRLYLEHEQGINRLRPFVASQRIYDQLLMAAGAAEADIATPFQALCESVLGARVAYLAALGPLAPLAGPALSYPDKAAAPLLALAKIAARFQSPHEICIPLQPETSGGAVWAVPLWSERGLIGALLLGEKRDGGLYTQEEIELARATGERLIDTQASTEMSRRLMALQRERLTESQIIDQQTRRVLHDEVLAHLHTAMLKLSSVPDDQAQNNAEVVALLGEMHHQIANLLHAIPTTTTREVARLGLAGALRQALDYELKTAFDTVTWQVEPEAAQAIQRLSPLTAEVIFSAAREALRNAARHGRNSDNICPLHVTLSLVWQQGLQVVIMDDGIGLGAADAAAKGSGHGLALHSTMMTVIGGTLTAESTAEGTRITLALPQELVPSASWQLAPEAVQQTTSNEKLPSGWHTV
jgi:signal transduction histidine kinase